MCIVFCTMVPPIGTVGSIESLVASIAKLRAAANALFLLRLDGAMW